MIDIYQENILDHYKHPRNFGRLDKFTHRLPGANLSCGDEIVWFLKVGADHKIEDAKFSGRACAICTASCSMLSEQIKGADTKQLRDLTTEDIQKNIGIPLSPIRLKCALLPLEALKGLTKE